MQISGPDYEAALREEMPRLEALHPERFRSLIIDGSLHTFFLGDVSSVIGDINLPGGFDDDFIASLLGGLDSTANGVRVDEWITAMLDNSEDWISIWGDSP